MTISAKCGCKMVQCDNCAKMVPAGEITRYHNPDTSQCASCTGQNARDIHPTCPVCGSCSECECKPWEW